MTLESASKRLGQEPKGKQLPERREKFERPQNFGLGKGHRHEKHVPNAKRAPHLGS